MAELTIHADWNAEAAVWSPRSADLPGLAIEAPMLDALLNRLRTTVCPLLPRMETCTGAAPTSHSCHKRKFVLGLIWQEPLRPLHLYAGPAHTVDLEILILLIFVCRNIHAHL